MHGPCTGFDEWGSVASSLTSTSSGLLLFLIQQEQLKLPSPLLMLYSRIKSCKGTDTVAKYRSEAWWSI